MHDYKSIVYTFVGREVLVVFIPQLNAIVLAFVALAIPICFVPPAMETRFKTTVGDVTLPPVSHPKSLARWP